MQRHIRDVSSFLTVMSFLFLFGIRVYASDTANAYTLDGSNETRGGSAGTTVITAYVPVSYRVMIPAGLDIPFGQETTSVGDVVLTESHLEWGYGVKVAIAGDQSLMPEQGGTDIPFTLQEAGKPGKLTEIVFPYTSHVGAVCPLNVEIAGDDWDRAPSGQYEATLTFSIAYGRI